MKDDAGSQLPRECIQVATQGTDVEAPADGLVAE